MKTCRIEVTKPTARRDKNHQPPTTSHILVAVEKKGRLVITEIDLEFAKKV